MYYSTDGLSGFVVVTDAHVRIMQHSGSEKRVYVPHLKSIAQTGVSTVQRMHYLPDQLVATLVTRNIVLKSRFHTCCTSCQVDPLIILQQKMGIYDYFC